MKIFGYYCRYALLILSACSAMSWAQVCGIPGRTGPSTTVAGTLNSYHPGNGAVAIGATSIPVGAIDTSSGGSASTVNTGDLLVIMQMQGAQINSSNSNCYGDGVGTAGCATRTTTTADYAGGNLATTYYAGNWEYCTAIGPVSGGAIPVRCAGGSGGTVNQYAQAAATGTAGAYRYQVIRVPQYSSATLSGTVTAASWNGSTGGVASLQVAGTLTMAGFTIDTAGRGFRGGGVTFIAPYGPPLLDGVNGSSYYTAVAGTVTGAGPGGEREGSFKGEGIAGTPRLVYDGTTQTDTGVEGYPNGSRGRGAPGNAGGGGNNQNGGGGGGGNGGRGGQGGGGWNDATRPTTFRDIGGHGGDGSSRAGNNLLLGVNRMIMGGGGGAGHVDGGGTACDQGGWGGNGGGIVIVKAGTFSGSGTLRANGSNGFTPNTAGGCTDAAGGGGAGGSVYVASDTGALSGLTINAVGGNGVNSSYMEHGPGGGGGGGIVNYTTPGAAPAMTVTGGTNGLDANSTAWFSTSGSVTATAAVTPLAQTRPPNAACLPNLTVTKSTSTPVVTESTSALAVYSISVANAGSGAAIGSDLIDNALPPGWTVQSVSSVTFLPALSATVLGGFVEGATPGVPAVANSPGGVANLVATGTAPSSPTAPFIGNLTIPASGAVTVTYIISIPDTATVGSYQNSGGVQFLDPVRTTATRGVTPATNNTSNRCSTAGASTTGCSASGNTVGATTNTSYQNGTAVAGSNYSGLQAVNTAEDVRLVPDLSISKSAPSTALTSATFLYTITATNVGRPVATQTFALTQATDVILANVPATLGSNPITITDTLPAGVTITSPFAGPGGIVCTGTSTIVCTVPNAIAYPLPTGGSAAIVATAALLAPCSAPATGRTNTAVISVMSGELVTSNNTAVTATVASCAADLSVTKSDGTTTVVAGAATTYTITVVNAGPDAVSGMVLNDSAGAGLSCTTASCSTSGGSVCPAPTMTYGSLTAGVTIPSLPPNSTATFLVNCGITATGQ